MGHRIEQMFLCTECQSKQLEQDHKIYIHICATYISRGKCVFRPPKQFELTNDDYKQVFQSVSNLEADRFIVSTECRNCQSLLYIKPTGYLKEENGDTVTHSFCAYRDAHDALDQIEED